MEAIIKVGHTQYNVKEGDEVLIAGRQALGEQVVFDQVLLIKDGEDVRLGQPYLKGGRVTAKALRHHSGAKVTTLRYRSTKDSSTKTGSRQRSTAMMIEKIEG